MIFQLAFLAIIGFTYGCEVHHIPIKEGRHRFHETMIVDKEAGTVEFITPDHGNREASTRKEFKNEGIYVNKVFARRAGDLSVCIFGKLEDDSKESVDTDEGDAKKVKGTSQDVDVKNQTRYIMPLKAKTMRKVELMIPAEEDAIPEVVKAYCGDLKIVGDKDEGGKSMKEIVKDALKIGKAAKHDARKRAVVREFIACTNASTMKIMTCPGDKLRAQCKIRRPHCTYKISCPMEAAKGGFNCKGLHKLNSIVCCDYDC